MKISAGHTEHPIIPFERYSPDPRSDPEPVHAMRYHTFPRLGKAG